MYLPLKAISLIEPPPNVSSLDWLPDNILMPVGTETAGQPFSLAKFPHCDGPIIAFDDPSYREIILQWATRLGKTVLFLSLFAKIAATDPHNMMFATSTKFVAGRVTIGRLYPILDSAVPHLLPSPHKRSMFEIRLGTCTIYVAWSGSVSTLADVGIYFGHGSEIDKWDDADSDEADPLELFFNRFKGFFGHKIALESSPTIRGKSRIEKRRLMSKNHRRYVPCPFCGERQILKKGSRESRGGIKWETDSKGQSDAEVAFQTAWYECEYCLKRIENHHRVQILRDGSWVPDGCSISSSGVISGVPVNERSDKAGFGPLASWYSLTETWGEFAKRWVTAKRSPRLLQDVVNSYMGETWERRQSKTKEETIGQRLNGKFPRGHVPVGVEFIVVGVDRQKRDGGVCPWVVLGHGSENRSWVIDYGMSATLPLVWENAIRQQWPLDGREGMMIATMSGIDSGWQAIQTYDFCAEHPDLLIAVKGSSGDLGGRPYDEKTLEEGRKGAGQKLIHINTDAWEEDLQNRLDTLLANEPGALTLCQEAAFDAELLSQLCNGELKDVVDSRGIAKMLWVVRDKEVPNDYRDCIRYALCLGKVHRDRPKELRTFTLPGRRDAR
jgi:phage terminase large subunit GpA-like protein